MFQFNNNSQASSSSSMMSSSSSMLLCDDNGITSQVELSFSCSNLVNLDILSKSDPQVIVYTRIPASNNNNNSKNSNGKNHSRSNSVYNNGNNNNNSSRSGVWHEIGRTEIIWDNLNPKFVKTFILNYRFESLQPLRFVVIDIDNQNSTRIEDQDLIGEAECSLGEIVGARGGLCTKKLVLPNNANKTRGFIHVRAEEVDSSNGIVHLQLGARDLDKKDWLGSSDPFFVLSRINEDGSFQPVFKSEVHKRVLSCKWQPLSISVQKLCNGDQLRSLRIEVFSHQRTGKHKLIGAVNTSLTELLSMAKNSNSNGNGNSSGKDNGGGVMELIKVKKQKKNKAYRNSGTLHIENIRLEKVSTFLDYIRGGYDINLIVAIDFTASNGDPRNHDSLHYIANSSSTSMNSYQRAIYSIGNILTHYDSDKKYPLFGFGAKIPPKYHVSHCFPLNFNWQQPEVYGVQGILQTYQNAIPQVTLHGPTNFAPVIHLAAEEARKNAETSYYILLIITDGEISDMDNTIHEIVESSDLPLSLIIVGVGDADFTRMDILDADDAPLTSRQGKRQTRDNVQFVPFRDFVNSPPSLLAEEVLREVPEQFLSYMTKHNVKPNPPVLVNPNMSSIGTGSNGNNAYTGSPGPSPPHHRQQQQQPPPPQQPQPYQMQPPPSMMNPYQQQAPYPVVQQQQPPPNYSPPPQQQQQQQPPYYQQPPYAPSYNQQSPVDLNQIQVQTANNDAQARWRAATYGVMFMNHMSSVSGAPNPNPNPNAVPQHERRESFGPQQQQQQHPQRPLPPPHNHQQQQQQQYGPAVGPQNMNYYVPPPANNDIVDNNNNSNSNFYPLESPRVPSYKIGIPQTK